MGKKRVRPYVAWNDLNKHHWLKLHLDHLVSTDILSSWYFRTINDATVAVPTQNIGKYVEPPFDLTQVTSHWGQGHEIFSEDIKLFGISALKVLLQPATFKTSRSRKRREWFIRPPSVGLGKKSSDNYRAAISITNEKNTDYLVLVSCFFFGGGGRWLVDSQ